MYSCMHTLSDNPSLCAWLQNAKESAPFTALHQENEELKRRLAALESAAAATAAAPATVKVAPAQATTKPVAKSA